MRETVLVVDDEPTVITLLTERLADKKVISATTLKKATALFETEDWNLVLMDQRLPDGEGLALLRQWRQQRPSLVAILMTGFTNIEDAKATIRAGIYDYVEKPFADLEVLDTMVERALLIDRTVREAAQRARAGRHAPALIGCSPALREVMSKATTMAKSDSSVLIKGASGTGKELMAQFIHQHSARAGKPFVPINCGALTESLLEATLFGAEKGAYTDAKSGCVGLFEQADGGTLFLDEIGNMSTPMQMALLRVLETGEYRRLGGCKTRHSDFRLLSATNSDLRKAVAKGQFRDDLFFRINGTRVKLPRLAERGHDVILLANHFLDAFKTDTGRAPGPLTPEAIQALLAERWPGNVRQLRNLIQALVSTRAKGPISAEDIHTQSQASSLQLGDDETMPPFDEALAHFEYHYLRNLLKMADGNMVHAATLAGLHRSRLYRLVAPHRARLAALLKP